MTDAERLATVAASPSVGRGSSVTVSPSGTWRPTVADLDLDAIAALLEAATPLPWSELSRSIWSEENGRSVALTTKQADAELIVWLRNHAEALVAVARWAQDAPHHDGCDQFSPWLGVRPDPRPCTCGRNEALAPFGGDRG